ncbi:MAG: protein kinase, partial [Polyangia bacterium]|nr:protein kinase [Polyangia bacterium]
MKPGEVYGKYRLMERIASGGMAEVYKAVAMGEAGFEKPVAIKLLHRQFSDDEDLVAMLQDEARLCSLLHHGNITQVLDLGRVEDTYYIAMEYVNGKDLFNLLRKASQTGLALLLPGALFIACEMLAGLDYAHRKRDDDGRLLGIIHRDISPQNVLITWDGEVKIIDFGIAKARTSTHKTQAGIIKGKFRYMSPEQARGEPIDHRADIFATGVVLYEMILGRPHAAGATDREILIKIQSGRFERLGHQVSGLPPELEEMVHRALATTPESRWPSARAFRTALMTYQRASRLAYSRDDLSEYIRYLFKEDTGQDTNIEAVGVLSDRDVLPGEGLAEAARDPFAPSLPPLPDLSFSGPSPAPPVRPMASALPPPASRSPEAPPAMREPVESRGKATVVLDTAARAAPMERPGGRRQQAEDTAHMTPAPPRRREPRRASSIVVAIRFLLFCGMLGLMGVGGYHVYNLYIKKPGVARRLGLTPPKPGMKRVSKTVVASFEIDSQPRGARIFLNGEDMKQNTPGVFEKFTSPRKVEIELKHPRFKAPW